MRILVELYDLIHEDYQLKIPPTSKKLTLQFTNTKIREDILSIFLAVNQFIIFSKISDIIKNSKTSSSQIDTVSCDETVKSALRQFNDVPELLMPLLEEKSIPPQNQLLQQASAASPLGARAKPSALASSLTAPETLLNKSAAEIRNSYKRIGMKPHEIQLLLKQRRIEKNKLSAKASRQRKKEKLDSIATIEKANHALKEKIQELQQTIATLKKERLEAENKHLKACLIASASPSPFVLFQPQPTPLTETEATQPVVSSYNESFSPSIAGDK